MSARRPGTAKSVAISERPDKDRGREEDDDGATTERRKQQPKALGPRRKKAACELQRHVACLRDGAVEALHSSMIASTCSKASAFVAMSVNLRGIETPNGTNPSPIPKFSVPPLSCPPRKARRSSVLPEHWGKSQGSTT